jgi:molybdopterin converting factor subunit 1
MSSPGHDPPRESAGAATEVQVDRPVNVNAEAYSNAESGARSTVRIGVLLFASAREAAGVQEVELAVARPATAGDVMTALVARLPQLAAHQASVRLAVNGEYVAATHPIRDGDEVALIPPTCGG